MGIENIRALKGMSGMYTGEQATPKLIASMQPKVRKPIPKKSAKAKEQAKVDAETFTLDKIIYAEIWAASPHMCQCGCKTKLGKEPLTTFFHHVLPKSLYPQFRHIPENIMILAPDCHNAVETSLDSRPVVKKRKQELTKLLLS